MKITKYALALALAFIGLAVPTRVRATIVNVTISNVTFNGNNACGPSGTALCTETLNAAFQWDNTTNTSVAGSLTFSASGAVGSSFTSGAGPALEFGSPLDVSLFLDSTNLSVSLETVLVENATNQLAPGTYSLAALPVASPGTWGGALDCGTVMTTCQNSYPVTQIGFLINNAAVATSGTVTVSPVPEPSSLYLFGTGFLGLLGAARRKWLA